jgi:phage tail sheath protein FI
MPEYLYPGVYVEEVDTGNKPIEGVSTSTVGFLGIAERGPTKPTLITSFPEFRQTFGSYVKEGEVDRYLAYGVEGFFQNGGQRCFVARVASSKAQNASLEVDAKITVNALGPGQWGNKIAVQIAASGLKNTSLFKFIVAYWSGALPNPLPDLSDPSTLKTSPPTLIEVFDNLSAVSGSSTFYKSEVNDMSNLVVLEQKALGAPGAAAAATLQGGTEGDPVALVDFEGDDSDPENKTGLVALGDIDEISLLCCPDEHMVGDITPQLVAQCENLKDRFAILQADGTAKKPDANDPPPDSKYAAFYYPWLKVTNPLTGVPLLVPPGGHIAGIYARSDTNRGVHKDPANEVIRAIDELQLQTNNQQQAILNPKGVNVLRFFKGSGNLVWGGRTISRDPDWKYINVRRLFIFVEKSIERGTQWVVFEPNDEPLWARVRRSVGDFLRRIWMDGMLQGKTPEQAYFVRCDRTTMTQADIDNGRMIMLIGIAPVKPAEFVIFRIGQWTGGSDVTEG